jgi:hypothetical protein
VLGGLFYPFKILVFLFWIASIGIVNRKIIFD